MAKSIAQLEKYLHNANLYKTDIENEIRVENEMEITVTKPRGYLIAGCRDNLKKKKEIEDFKILRESLKNIEILLYDELLERLKNLSKNIEKTLNNT